MADSWGTTHVEWRTAMADYLIEDLEKMERELEQLGKVEPAVPVTVVPAEPTPLEIVPVELGPAAFRGEDGEAIQAAVEHASPPHVLTPAPEGAAALSPERPAEVGVELIPTFLVPLDQVLWTDPGLDRETFNTLVRHVLAAGMATVHAWD